MWDEQHSVGVIEAHTAMGPTQGNDQEVSLLALIKNKRRTKGLKHFFFNLNVFILIRG